MASITLQIPEEFQKPTEEAATSKDVITVEGVTESVVTTQDETEAVVVEVDEAEAVASQRASAKAEKFKELAERRVNKVLEELDKLEALANTRNYQYSTEQIDKIFTELQKCLDEKRLLFEGVRKPRFTFDK